MTNKKWSVSELVLVYRSLHRPPLLLRLVLALVRRRSRDLETRYPQGDRVCLGGMSRVLSKSERRAC